MLPEEIKYLLDNYDVDDISLIINKADYSGDNPNLSLTLTSLQSGKAPQKWTLEIVGHRASQLSFSSIISDTAILLTSDHPLLWQYADIQSELFFNGSSKDIFTLISELNYIDFELFSKYQNSSEQLYKLFKSSHGSLGKGSQKLLTKYADCLNKYGIKTSIIGGYIPTYSDGKNMLNGATLKIFIAEGSYIVGQDFIFTKVED